MEDAKVFTEALLREIRDSSATVATYCARVLDDSKMEDVKVFDVAASLQIADYFVVASGSNPRQLKATSDELVKKLRESGVVRSGLEGYGDEASWILIDLDGVVVHLFQTDSRRFYDLDNLWGDCPRISWEVAAPAVRGSTAGSKLEDG